MKTTSNLAKIRQHFCLTIFVAAFATPSAIFCATISSTPYIINGGQADFGDGLHAFGSPTGNGFVTWDLTPVNGVLTATAFVDGRLYYDNANGPGSAALVIQYKRVTAAGTLETIHTSQINLSGPGGDANNGANQDFLFNEHFADRDLHTVVVTTFEVHNGALTNGNFIVDPTDTTWSFSPKINNGQTDFGTGNHSFGSPSKSGFVGLFRRLPNVALTPTTPLGSMLGSVTGTLYWDDLFSGGTARIVIDFQDANGNNLATRTRDLNGTGGDANNSSNQRAISENFSSPSLFKVRLRVGKVSNGSFTNVTSKTFVPDSSSAGTFQLVPATANVAVHDRLNYQFTWTVPSPSNWHDLQSLKLHLRDSDGVIFSLLFDEASQTFALVDETTGKVGHAFPAGSNAQLESNSATLYLADTSVVGSGPTGPSVTLNLALSFKPQAANRVFVVEVGGADDQGNEDTFTPAGSVSVTEKNGTTSGIPAKDILSESD